MKNFDITPYFFSHNCENVEEYKKILIKSLNDYVNWRKEFHNEDFEVSCGFDKKSKEYKNSLKHFKNCYNEMLLRLHNSIPFYSPRYIGHMQSEKLMPCVLGYFAALLYNLNNVCFEGSPVTVQMEYEVAKDIAKMVGYDANVSWGHLTSGGTTANIEALWVIRNTKHFPVIAQNVAKKYNRDFNVVMSNGEIKKLNSLNQNELLNLPPDSIRLLIKYFFTIDWGKNIYQDIYVDKQNISHIGMKNFYSGKILVPATKHYSWDKAAEILGFGRENIILVDVDDNFSMDITDLKKKLIYCAKNNYPIVAVVGVMGSTESSSVDSIDKIQKTREFLEKKYNTSFFIHIDAAYGGYVKSLFLNSKYKTKSYKKVKEFLNCAWPTKDVYNSYCAMSCADSITIDPHKLGYLPYASGAVIYKNKIIKPSTVAHAPYISGSTNPENNDLFFGEYVLEGSKSGATAAACWLANKILPLNDNGYGKIIKNQIYDCDLIVSKFKKAFPIVINDKKINIEIFNNPNIDIVLYAFNYEGNKSIAKFNEFNTKILKKMSFDVNKPVKEHNYMVVSTMFDHKTYKNSIDNSLKNLGLDIKKWQENQTTVELFRSVVMNVNLYTDELKNYYYDGFVDEFKKAIKEVINEELC